jgi:lipopolysaccharide biosynthesis glycosyltransferase
LTPATHASTTKDKALFPGNQMVETKRYAVVVCADARMAAAACAVLLNVQQKSSENLALYFVGLALNDVEKGKVADFARIKKCPIQLVNFTLQDLDNHDVGRFGLAALSRLYIDQLLPKNHDRVLYLDVDVFVSSSIDTLFRSPLGTNQLGAVKDISKHGPDHVTKRSRELGLTEGRDYFMSGMLLFAWPPEKLNGLANSRVALEKGKDFKFPDQDAINLGYDGEYSPINPAWNAEPFLWKMLKTVHIFHFSGRIKPWHAEAPLQYEQFRREYADALEGTPWRDWVKKRSLADWYRTIGATIVFAWKVNKKRRRVTKSYGRNAFDEPKENG